MLLVDVRVILFLGDLLRLSRGALFRENRGWAVFLDDHGRASPCRVKIGQRNDIYAQIKGCLAVGQKVMLYVRVHNGVTITQR